MGFSWESSSISIVRISYYPRIESDAIPSPEITFPQGGKNEGNPSMVFVRQTHGRVLPWDPSDSHIISQGWDGESFPCVTFIFAIWLLFIPLCQNFPFHGQTGRWLRNTVAQSGNVADTRD